MEVKNLFKKIPWSQLAIGVVSSVIATYLISIFSKISFAKIWGNIYNFIIQVLKFELPLYIFLTGIIIFTASKKLSKRLKSSGTPLVATPENKQQLPPNDKRYPFNSRYSLPDSYQIIGEQLWNDQAKRLEGPVGTGKSTVEDKIIEIQRSNLDGQYIIRIVSCYYSDSERTFIPSDKTGNKLRSFKFEFYARSLKGQQKIIVVFKRHNSHVWVLNVSIPIQHDDWQRYFSSIRIECHEDFVIELRVFEVGKEPGIIQIKDILMSEEL